MTTGRAHRFLPPLRLTSGLAAGRPPHRAPTFTENRTWNTLCRLSIARPMI